MEARILHLPYTRGPSVNDHKGSDSRRRHIRLAWLDFNGSLISAAARALWAGPIRNSTKGAETGSNQDRAHAEPNGRQRRSDIRRFSQFPVPVFALPLWALSAAYLILPRGLGGRCHAHQRNRDRTGVLDPVSHSLPSLLRFNRRGGGRGHFIILGDRAARHADCAY